MSNTVHVYPLKDIIEHVTDGSDCPCQPETEVSLAADGSTVGWLVKHRLGGDLLAIND